MSQRVESRIRQETTADQPAIDSVVRNAFGSPLQADLVVAIRASPHYVPEWALVAEIASTVVGHVMVSFASIEHDGSSRRVAMLSPLAVAPAHQRHGVGVALVRAVTALVDAAGEPLVILEGSPHYYGPLGFEPADPLGIHIHLPSWAPPEAAQVLRLRAYDPAVRGQVVYPPAFDNLEDA